MKKTDDEYISVRPDLRFPRRLRGTGTFGDQSYQVDFEASWNSHGYEVDSIRVYREPGSADVAPIDGAVTRSVRIQQAFEQVMHACKNVRLSDGRKYEFPYEWAFETDASSGKTEVMVKPKLIEVSLSKKQSDAQRLLEAARLYAIGTAFGVRALKLVCDVLDMNQRTASRLIIKARNEGLLDSSSDSTNE